MLNISGPPPVMPPQRSEDSTLVLRLNQRIVAEVMQVSGDNVTLAVDGVRFVARLTSSEQAAALQERREAAFIIRDINANQVIIQLAPSAGQAASTGQVSQDLARTLLGQLGLPENETNLALLRMMLSHGLPADFGTFSELQSALSQIEGWGSLEAQAAVTLKAAGLPVTPATIAMMLNAPQETVQAYTRLLNLLQGLSARQVSPQAAQALQGALATLHDSALAWTGNSSAMAESLRQVVAMLGSSVEATLAERILHPDTAGAQARGLFSLLALRRELARSGPREVVEAIDRFLEALRWQHFQSSELDPAPGRSEWISLRLPVHVPPAESQESRPQAYQEARLRIACRRDGEERKVAPDYTRFVLTVELAKDISIEVDLSVVERRIGMQVMASTPALCELAKEELPSFSAGLSELGFDLQTSRFEVGAPREPLAREAEEISPQKYLAIDLEI